MTEENIPLYVLLKAASKGDEKDYWTSAGKQIKYTDLEDSHLKNIIKDGYRNLKIFEEAERRGFDVPDRLVDKLSLKDMQMWVESFASCSLSDNEYAKKMIELHRNNRSLFRLELNRMLERQKEEEENS